MRCCYCCCCHGAWWMRPWWMPRRQVMPRCQSKVHSASTTPRSVLTPHSASWWMPHFAMTPRSATSRYPSMVHIDRNCLHIQGHAQPSPTPPWRLAASRRLFFVSAAHCTAPCRTVWSDRCHWGQCHWSLCLWTDGSQLRWADDHCGLGALSKHASEGPLWQNAEGTGSEGPSPRPAQ